MRIESDRGASRGDVVRGVINSWRLPPSLMFAYVCFRLINGGGRTRVGYDFVSGP